MENQKKYKWKIVKVRIYNHLKEQCQIILVSDQMQGQDMDLIKKEQNLDKKINVYMYGKE